MKKFDVTALGELLVDELRLDSEVMENVGGAPANLVRGAARRGLRCAFIGAVGRDARGAKCAAALEADGVDAAGLVFKDAATTLALVTVDGAGERSFEFIRGADALLDVCDVDMGIIQRSRLLHIGTLSLAAEPAGRVTLAALEAAERFNVPVSCDINYRDALWPSPEAARQAALGILPRVTLLKASGEEAELLTGYSEPEKAAKALTALGARLTAVTLGADGAVICTGGETRYLPALPVTAVDTTGAGDSFWAAFLASLLGSGWHAGDVDMGLAEACGQAGAAAAAECVTRKGAL